MYEKEIAEALQVYERLPPHRREAMMQSILRSTRPESMAVHDRLSPLPDRDRALAEAERSGDVGAIMLVAHGLQANGCLEEAQAQFIRAYDRGSAEAAFHLGYQEQATYPKVAFSFLRVAMERFHPQAPFALANLCRNLSAQELGVGEEERSRVMAEAVRIADALLFALAHEALVTGTHPVQFISEHGIPWGTGSFFLVDWKGCHLAITAAHVLKAAQANWDQARLLVPGESKGLPYKYRAMPEFRDEIGELLDLHVWELDRDNPEGIAWHAWDLGVFWMPASEVRPGDPLFVVGYPNTEDKIDFERREMLRQPLIVRARLSAQRAGDLFSIECAPFSMDVDGLSGGPVFTMVGGTFFFVGMALWGGAASRRLHFRDASEIVQALDAVIATGER